MSTESQPLTRIRNTLVLSAISGIISGLSIALLSQSVLFYFPGILFGFLFAVINLRRILHILLFTVASGAIYVGAVQIFFTSLNNPAPLLPGLLAGLSGALALALVTKILSSTPVELLVEIRTTIIGGLAGIAFTELIFRATANSSLMTSSAAFAVWQVAVGCSLAASIHRGA